jgi:hypothetical protein
MVISGISTLFLGSCFRNSKCQGIYNMKLYHQSDVKVSTIADCLRM